jgi:hypothetical protein
VTNETVAGPVRWLAEQVLARDVVLLLVGALIGWLIAAYYYRKSTLDARRLVVEAKTAGLSIPDLHILLTTRVIDPQNAGPFPFKACPQCGSESVEEYMEDNVEITDQHEDGSPEYTNFPTPAVRCTSCGWHKGMHTGDAPLGI